ncbi:M12 family metallo-peptidase [Marinicella meishanensis]|uniref:M12 family metallo-peptidase n=1 Tax=Marinicella meishanensis TaxID=2873263 RepID=UPI001CBB0BC6|nr:M12 family metallo-peptidase [Marinicella sp. NBU2979]
MIRLTTQVLLTVFATWAFAQTIESQLPEAYAGLNDSAYHRIELTHNKSTALGFRLGERLIQVPLTQAKATGTQAGNVSFTQAIPGGSISATRGKDSLFGQLRLDNKHHILTTNQAGIWAVELPQSGLRYNDCGMDHDHSQHHKALELPVPAKNSQVAGTVIDVLMLYDQAIRDRYPGNLLQARVDQYFHVSNQSYANSGIDLAIRQVGLEQTGYNFDDANGFLRNNIQTVLANGVGLQGLENLPQLYAETGADLVIFLRTHSIETRGNCGIAFFPVSDGVGGFDPSYGVNVMADGMSSWSVCTDQLMVHEIGHNLSAGHHNWDPTQFGFPAAARGFAVLGQYGTIMGSFGTGQPDRFYELDVFSGPSVQCGGAPCGAANQTDNISVINSLMGPVSNYQPSISSAPMPDDFTRAMPDQDGDGVIDWDDAFPFNANETNDADSDGVGDNGDAFPNDFSEQLDTDGDGIGNNTDFDDDQDGILDGEDDFPLDPTEVKDSDRDGVGDNTDALVFEVLETRDHDEDGIGNHADDDDDNDGVIDLSSDLQDVLVMSLGNNRILRFDAHTGLAKGIEVLPDDGLLTFQSDLTVDNRTQTLYYSTNSSIKTLDLMNRSANPKLLLPAYADEGASIGTGFPTALENGPFDRLAVAKLQRTNLDAYDFTNISNINQYFLGFLADAETENIIDLKNRNGYLYALGQNNRVYKIRNVVFDQPTDLSVVGNGNMAWLEDPYAFAVTDNDILIHTDQKRNKLLLTDGNDGSFEGVFADIAELGYSNPTGIVLTQDGRVLVAVSDQNAILHFDLASGEFLGELVSGLGLSQPHKMVLVSQLVDRFHEDENKVIRPNAGSWYNPASAGRGFNIGIFGDRIQVLWYTYDEQGLPIWYFTADFLEGMTYDTEILKTFQIDDSTITFESVGTLRIDFANERQANVTWQLGDDSGSEPIEWLQFSGEPEGQNYTGLWSRPDSPGWGLAVTTIGEKSITIPFIYDSAGEPRWVISGVVDGAAPLAFEMFTAFSDNLCPSCSGPPDAELIPSGTMTLGLNLDGDSTWSSAVLWADPVPGTWDLDAIELIRINSDPVRPR